VSLFCRLLAPLGSIAHRPFQIMQWVIVDSIVYDMSKFSEIHPGGLAALLDPEVGKSGWDFFHPFVVIGLLTVQWISLLETEFYLCGCALLLP
jgi:hypothetical protein